MPLYFAYGSNLDLAAMAARCPGSKPLGVARLPRHRFVVTRDGYASVARDPRRTVWGLVWNIPLADMPALDRYESVATGLYVKLTQSVITDRGARRVLIYVGRSSAAGQPRAGYLEGVAAAARGAGLPGDYIAEIEAWLPRAGGAQQVAAPATPSVRPLWSNPLARPFSGEGLPPTRSGVGTPGVRPGSPSDNAANKESKRVHRKPIGSTKGPTAVDNPAVRQPPRQPRR